MSDWWAWERSGHAPLSLDGNGFATRYAEDFAQLAELGLLHHRLSIEWARLEPARGEHDAAAIDHYRMVLEAARAAGIAPWACLHHFTLPRWFADIGGFLVDANRTDSWARHVEFVAETFGDLVFGWQPLNEANLYSDLAYGGGGWPPGRNDPFERALADEEIQLANAEAAVRLRQTGKPVASIFGLSPAVAIDDDPASLRAVTDHYDTLWAPGLGLFRDGVLRVPHRAGLRRDDLAGAFDLIGFSYYATTGFRRGGPVPYPEGAPRSPLGYAIDADGLALVLDRLDAELPGTPILVAEYGIGTDDDDQRSAYLQRGLAVTHDALSRGVDVRGFFHWTAGDNYEWLHGYDVRFGLIDRERHVKASASVLQREAMQGARDPGRPSDRPGPTSS